MPEGVVTQTWAHPTSAAEFACQWRTRSRRAALGRRVGARATSRSATSGSSRSRRDAARDLRVRRFAVRGVDARLRRDGRRLREAAPAAPAPASDAGRARLAHPDAPDDVAASSGSPADLLAELGYERPRRRHPGGRAAAPRRRTGCARGPGTAPPTRRSARLSGGVGIPCSASSSSGRPLSALGPPSRSSAQYAIRIPFSEKK